jgi:hypothetical protein
MPGLAIAILIWERMSPILPGEGGLSQRHIGLQIRFTLFPFVLVFFPPKAAMENARLGRFFLQGTRYRTGRHKEQRGCGWMWRLELTSPSRGWLCVSLLALHGGYVIEGHCAVLCYSKLFVVMPSFWRLCFNACGGIHHRSALLSRAGPLQSFLLPLLLLFVSIGSSSSDRQNGKKLSRLP